ncbi:ADP-ribosyl-(dinitrogen reductase) hydrolase [Salinarchaeum sp. Harcht-Bsk1]|uniref:ADP-ribosylglycohydrolase family protein n=1 Tax=Salinarchaeum sp. Harcht-Bsk1 TaxID=1333523 RepID=UPI0003424945|nr:ADP-ribosylglycohydrolase family protein [Salinarchaeum sp. Harcht-Bsk1]AGN01226.1 ADP-ribosyl-(dinitrogen reductase) hydrolase [Salinarchaeum sp. Harcht-Bsk1]
MNPNRAEGVLLGLACGDALGRPVEFDSPEQIADEHGTLTDMVGFGTWNQPAGTLTDDTEQALCIASSVAEHGSFDPADVAERFRTWYESEPFDVGVMTRRSLEALDRGAAWDEAGQSVWEDSPEGQNAGNGSVMRCPPLTIPLRNEPERLVEASKQSSQITHADPRCTWGCAALNLTIAGYLTDREAPLQWALDRIRSDAPDELVDALDPIAAGETPDSLSTSGYVVDTLQTALHDAIAADSASDAIVTAVNRGGDADTIGAVAGAVAGARFGAVDLDREWLVAIDETEAMRSLAIALV